MSDTAPEPAKEAAPKKKPAPAPLLEDKTFLDILKSLLGKVVTFVNAESFEEGGLGHHKLEAGWYKGRLQGLGSDYLIVITEFEHGTGKMTTKEPVKQYLPLDKVKRVSLMKTGALVHI